MQYMGSKRRIAEQPLNVIKPYRKPGQTWVEPFVGGANMIDHVSGERIGNDANKYLVALLKAFQDGWIPPTDITEEIYNAIKKDKDQYEERLVGFCGFCCAFGSKFFNGYARDNRRQNFALQGCRRLLRQRKYIDGVKFVNYDYRDLPIPANSLIYCDPPYFGLTKYSFGIDHDEFWAWCREKNGEGHTVFVSESTAPDDFECLFEIEKKCPLNHNTTKKEKAFYERLFKQKV